MRIYVKKIDKGFVVYKETLKQSLISDMITMFTMAFLIGLDVLFSIYIMHSFVIDAMVVFFLLIYISSFKNKKEEVKSRFELIKIINEITE